ncbi:hypothetical protein NMG60_11005051, partial [Bertholletia excelsa]
MASLESPNSAPRSPSFTIGPPTSFTFVRSISNKEPSFASSDFSCARPRLSHVSFSPVLFSSQSPPLAFPSHLTNQNDAVQASAHHRCVSSVLKKDGQILAVASALDGGLIYTGSGTNVVRVWRLPEFAECGQLKTRSAAAVVAIEVSNNKVYAAYTDGKIRVWRRSWDGAAKHARLGTIPSAGSYVRSYISSKEKTTKHLAPISSLAMNVSDDILYSASLDKTVKVWRISDHKCIETIQAHSEPVNAVAVGGDGVLYTASDDATVRVWRRNFWGGGDDRPHSLTLSLPAKESPVKALSLTADGSVLYGGCTDGYVHFWFRGWFTGQLQYGGALQGHTHAVLCLASVGNFVVSGSADATGRVWVREQDGQHMCIAVLQGHRGPIRSVAALPRRTVADEAEEGCTVCTGSLDGVLKVWRVTFTSNSGRAPAENSREYSEM